MFAFRLITCPAFELVMHGLLTNCFHNSLSAQILALALALAFPGPPICGGKCFTQSSSSMTIGERIDV